MQFLTSLVHIFARFFSGNSEKKILLLIWILVWKKLHQRSAWPRRRENDRQKFAKIKRALIKTQNQPHRDYEVGQVAQQQAPYHGQNRSVQKRLSDWNLKGKSTFVSNSASVCIKTFVIIVTEGITVVWSYISVLSCFKICDLNPHLGKRSLNLRQRVPYQRARQKRRKLIQVRCVQDQLVLKLR